MPVLLNLRHLETDDIHLEGKLPVEDLDLDLRDDIIRAETPLGYDLQAQKLGNAILVQGRLRLLLRCYCVRCLKPFEHVLELRDWAMHLPLEGEEQGPVSNDCVDLTPGLREDILLALPQHPLCEANCGGLPKPSDGKAKAASDAGPATRKPSAWAELDKLKL